MIDPTLEAAIRDAMAIKCGIHAARIKAAGAQFEKLLRQLDEKGLTPALMRHTASAMERLASVMEEGLLDRQAAEVLDELIAETNAAKEE